MKYDIRFPTRRLEKYFDEFLKKEVPHRNLRVKIASELNELVNIPRPFQKKSFTEIKPPIGVHSHRAEYRLRIADYRILFNVDDKERIVWLLDIRRRSEKTYKR